MLHSLLIKSGTKDMVIPLTEGLPELESVVEVEKFVALSAKEEELFDKYFYQKQRKHLGREQRLACC